MPWEGRGCPHWLGDRAEGALHQGFWEPERLGVSPHAQPEDLFCRCSTFRSLGVAQALQLREEQEGPTPSTLAVGLASIASEQPAATPDCSSPVLVPGQV